MALIVFFLLVIGICVLGALYGVDSRHNDPGSRHRPNLL
jgi:hypothetical protein